MYVPHRFRESRPDVLDDAARAIQLAALVTPASSTLQVSHVPMVLKRGSPKDLVLETHVARANEHWTHVAESGLSVAIFQGPQAYISPRWYDPERTDGKVVPTWNYIAVHAHGRLETIEDEEWLLAHLDDLIRQNEKHREEPWSMSDAPSDFVRALATGIVGLRMTVEHYEGSWKMIQHRSEADRMGAINGLLKSNDLRDHMVAQVMLSLSEQK